MDFYAAHIVCFVFPKDSEPTIEQVKAHVREDQRERLVEIIRVSDSDDMRRVIFGSHFEELPFKIFVTKSAPSDAKKLIGNVID